MPQSITTLVTTSLWALLVAATTAVITFRLLRKRLHAELGWERKADAYSRITAALHSLMACCSAWSEENQEGRTMSDERQKELAARFQLASEELQKAANHAACLMSEQVEKALWKLIPQLTPVPDPGRIAPEKFLRTEYAACASVLAEIRALAKVELGISNDQARSSVRIGSMRQAGILCSAGWAFLGVTLYFVGILLHPSPLTDLFSRLYSWVEKELDGGRGVQIWPLSPTVNPYGLALLVLFPVIMGWLLAYLMPHTVAWIREGFRQQKERIG